MDSRAKLAQDAALLLGHIKMAEAAQQGMAKIIVGALKNFLSKTKKSLPADAKPMMLVVGSEYIDMPDGTIMVRTYQLSLPECVILEFEPREEKLGGYVDYIGEAWLEKIPLPMLLDIARATIRAVEAYVGSAQK